MRLLSNLERYINNDDLLFEQPYCKITSLVNRKIAKAQTASVYLRELEALGILYCEQHGREKYYIHKKLLSIIMRGHDEF